MKPLRFVVAAALAAAAMLAVSARPAAAQWQIHSADGKSSLTFGVLAQPQFESIDTASGGDTTKNFFLRRIRILFGGEVSDTWTFFVDTDSPNLGKATTATGVKDTGSIYIQDAYVTYNDGDAFKVDVGMILVPLGHNHGQSAATLLPVDYGPYSFSESAPIGARQGRDYGVQVRGYPLGQHLEYRLGAFQGIRGADATNAFRVAGRAVWYPFAADTGFFYGGTYQGTKRLLALGAGFDTQKDYRSYAADVFLEQPINEGEQGVTAQFNWIRFHGGALLSTALPQADTFEVEAGFHLCKGKLTPLVQYSKRNFQAATTPDQTTWQAGVAYWMAGHQRNVKATAGRQHTDGQPDRTQVLVQLQIFYF